MCGPIKVVCRKQTQKLFYVPGYFIQLEEFSHNMDQAILYHDYVDHMSFPHCEPVTYDCHDSIITRAKHQIYSDSLLAISHQARENVRKVKQKLMVIDPCRAYWLQHWHPENPNKGEKCKLDREFRKNAEWPKWGKESSMFSSEQDRKKLSQQTDDQTHSKEDESIKLCYLCSTLEEHKQHIARRGRQFKEKKKVKPRIQYVPPPPIVEPKPKVVEEKKEVLYRVDVTTADRADAATSANVTVKMKGTKGTMRPRPLKKNIGVNFTFGRGTTETFYIKGPDVGEIKLIALEHDGMKKQHAWFLDRVKVTSMTTGKAWLFIYKNWISMYHGDYELKKVLQARPFEEISADLEVSVSTGDFNDAGTTSNVFITVYGKKGVGRKEPLKSKAKGVFDRGATDKFVVSVKADILPITKIRIEHDNSGDDPDWFLEKVIIADCENHQKYSFPCAHWLSTEDSLFVDLFPVDVKLEDTKKGWKDARGPTIRYDVSVLTGTKTYAGTDARVYVQFFGANSKSSEVELNDGKDHFEKGCTDKFKIRAEDVGPIHKLRIRHDNSGMGAGWFLDKLTVRRYFPETEVQRRLQELYGDKPVPNAHDDDLEDERRLSSPGRTKDKRRTSKSSRNVSSDSESDSDSDANVFGRKGKKEKQNKKEKDRSTNRQYKSKQDESFDSEDSDDDESRYSRHSGSKGRRGYSKRERGSSESPSRGRYDGEGRRRKSKYRHSDTEDDSDNDVYVMGRVTIDEKNRQEKRRGRSANSSESEFSTSHRRHKTRQDSESEYSESESDGSTPTKRKPRKRYNSGRFSVTSTISEQVPTSSVWQENRIPHFDEYLFICKKWLARDEGDGRIEREMKPKSITTFYKVKM